MFLLVSPGFQQPQLVLPVRPLELLRQVSKGLHFKQDAVVIGRRRLPVSLINRFNGIFGVSLVFFSKDKYTSGAQLQLGRMITSPSAESVKDLSST